MWDAVASELATVPIHQQLCLENYFSRPSELSSQGAVPISPAPWDGRAFWWYQQPVCISKSHFPQLYAAGGLHRVVGGSWVSPVLPCRLPLFEIKPGRRVQSLFPAYLWAAQVGFAAKWNLPFPPASQYRDHMAADEYHQFSFLSSTGLQKIHTG